MKLSMLSSDGSVRIYVIVLLASAGLHLMAYYGLQMMPRTKHERVKKRRVVKFRVLPKKRKKPVVRKRPKPKPKPRKRKIKKKKKKKKKVKKRKKRKKRRRPPPPPPNRRPPKRPPPQREPVQPIFGLTQSSLSNKKGPGPNFRAGNTLMKEPTGRPVDPKKIRPYYGPQRPVPPRKRRDVFKPIPVYEVDENPRELRKVAAKYPAAAKRENIQAVVVLSVEVRKNGRVRRVRVISVRPSSARKFGFGKAAVRAIRKFRFRPARYKGKPVDVVIRYIYRFELED
jgi:protein TonB